MNIEHNYFKTEEEVQAEIAELGYHPITLESGAESVGDHWHEFDSVVYILDGEITITESETGESCVCVPGTKITAPKGILHREESPGNKVTVGVAIPLDQITEPVNKPPPVTL